MFRQMLTRVGVPAVVAAVLLMAAPAWAQHRGGGGHGGGFPSGGFHSGSFHPGGFRPGSFPSGSFRPGGFQSNRFHGGSFHHNGFPRFFGSGFYPGYYPSYGYYPPYSYYPPYDLGYDSDPDLGYPDYSYGGVAPSYPSGDPALEPPSTVSPDTAPAQADAAARVTVRVPANAQLWIEGSKMTSTGSVREFQSPPLSPGRYTYEIRARWTENGRDITQTQQVDVSPGAHLTVDFPTRSRTD